MEYYASGKLLLFGEYLVLKGAPALGIPLRLGQSLSVERNNEKWFSWESKINGTAWFSCSLSSNLELLDSTDPAKANILLKLLKIIKEEKNELFNVGLNFQTNMDFPLEWGFGSSSTLLSCLSQWSKIDPFYLLHESFGGSGYDIACATSNTPILFDIKTKQSIPVYLFPKITSKVLFIYSGKKQNSYHEVSRFNSIKTTEVEVEKMKGIILRAIQATQISAFENDIMESEELLSGIVGLPSIKKNKFADYPFAVKSLGAWNGDFFMATFRKEKDALAYFISKGYSVFFNYNQLIKK